MTARPDSAPAPEAPAPLADDGMPVDADVREARPGTAAAGVGWGGPATALAVTVVGAAVVLLSSGRPWVHAVAGSAGVRLGVTATGHDVSGLPTALGLLAIAAGLALLATRRLGRMATGALLVAAGAVTTAVAVQAAADPAAAVAPRVAAATGGMATTASGATATGWMILTAVGGVLVVLGGAFTVLRGRSWPRMSARYERDSADRVVAVGSRGTPRELWSALDRGDDPTIGPG